MAIPVHLNTETIQQSRHSFDVSLSGVVYNGFNSRLGSALASTAVRADFNAPDAIGVLHETADQAAPTVLRNRHAYEAKYGYGGRQVHELLGRLMLADEAVGEMVPDAPFMRDLHDQIDLYAEGVDTLQSWHAMWPPKTFTYLESIHAEAMSDAPGKADTIFEIVKTMANDPENLTLAPDKSEALYLLTHLPSFARQVTRRLLAGNHLIAKVDQALGDHKTPHEAAMLQALHRYYTLDTLHGQHWEEPSYPLSEAHQVEIATFSTEQLQAAATLQRLGDDTEQGQHFIDTWARVTDQLDEYLEDVVTEMAEPTKQWQLRDVSHCFDHFRDEGLQKAFRRDIYGDPRRPGFAEYRPSKNGLKAAIFEDDDVQRARWVETVDAYTPFVAPEELALPTEEGLDAAIDDPEVGLFLIDIQNGEDLTAGIRWGEEVLRRRFTRAARTGEAESIVPTKIVVWSASIDAVHQAAAHFAPIVEQLEAAGTAGISYSVGKERRFMTTNPIDFAVQRKTWTRGILD